MRLLYLKLIVLCIYNFDFWFLCKHNNHDLSVFIFSYKKNIKIKLWICVSDKFKVCKICSKRFLRNSALDKHLRIHSEVKPFSCSVCSKYFNLKENLNKHMKIHSGIKEFVCHVCNKMFTQKVNLNRHMYSIHKWNKY